MCSISIHQVLLNSSVCCVFSIGQAPCWPQTVPCKPALDPFHGLRVGAPTLREPSVGSHLASFSPIVPLQ